MVDENSQNSTGPNFPNEATMSWTTMSSSNRFNTPIKNIQQQQVEMLVNDINKIAPPQEYWESYIDENRKK